MVRAGADGFRLNFSHGSLDEKRKVISVIRGVEREEGLHLPIIGDLQGPKIRLGDFKPFRLGRGSVFKLSRRGGEGSVPLVNTELLDVLDEGDEVVFGDGDLMAVVVERGDDEVLLESMTEGVLEPRRTVTVRGKEVDLPPLTEKDLRDLEFIAGEDLEMVALSFVKHREDVALLRSRLRDLGSKAWVVSKIETVEAVRNLEEIVEESDLVLVARGDLGTKLPLETIPQLQRRIIEVSMEYGKPSVVATQLLDSMIEKPAPTRSEVVDVYEAVSSGCDCLLLTNETAVGKYPVESLEWLSRIAVEAEGFTDPPRRKGVKETLYDKFALGVVELAEAIDACIIAYTRAGNTARRLARYRPRVDVFAFSGNVGVLRRLNLLWGVTPKRLVRGPESLEALSGIARSLGLHAGREALVMVRGSLGETTDTVRVEKA